MKTVMIFFLMVLFPLLSYSQTARIAEEKTVFAERVQAGEIKLEMPSNITSADVEKNAAYYTDYFTVDFDENTQLATIKMKENTPNKRRVIMRFLYSCGLNSVTIDSEEITIHDFNDRYLK